MDVSKIHTPMTQPQGIKKLDSGDSPGSAEHFMALLGPLREENPDKKKKQKTGNLQLGQNMPRTGPALAPAPPRPLYPDETDLENEQPGMALDKRA